MSMLVLALATASAAIPNEYLVQFAKRTNSARVAAAYHGTVVRTLPHSGLALLRLDPDAAKALRDDAGVERIEPNYVVSLDAAPAEAFAGASGMTRDDATAPSDPDFFRQYALQNR